MKRIALLLMTTLFIAAGCSTAKTFQATIDNISENEIVVNCSDEFNKGKKNVNSLGYLCRISIHDSTVFKDSAGNTLALDDFFKGDDIRITSSKKVKEENRNFEASEIIEIVLIEE